MFTGIVEETGQVRHVAETPSGRRIELSATKVLEGLEVGASVSVSGVCLTVVARDDRSFSVDVVPETLGRTTLGHAARGAHVNLERAATPQSALGGHIVQGHVDATARIMARRPEGDGARLRIALARPLARYVAEKGSIAIDGVSLTVARAARTSFEVALIPHTLRATTLGALREGDVVNIEVDVIAKYLERLLEQRGR